MSGGVAVRANLLCVTWSAAQGHVFLFDLEARERVSTWTLPSSDDGRGFSDAAGVAMDEHFHLYVADAHNHRVRHFSAFGRHIGDFGRSPPPTGDVARDRAGILDQPRAVAVIGRTILVTCGDQPRRFAVQRFDRDGNVLSPLQSRGDPEAEFGAPQAIWADTEVLVADTLAGRIQRFRPDGTFVAAFASGGPGALSRPVAVARCPGDASILVVDRGDDAGLRRFSPAGAVLPVPDALQQNCVDPTALTVDEGGRVYVLDHHGERVQRFTPDLDFDTRIVDLAEHLDDFEPPRSEP